jgi:hypothetical protein
MELLMGSFYSFSPQGRIQAFATLSKQQVAALAANAVHTNSTAFKTSAGYGYQPVLGSPIVSELLRKYLSDLRPRAVYASGNPSLDSDTSAAFLKFKYVK